jgi:GNAT superfamily N-acetyltransferase
VCFAHYRLVNWISRFEECHLLFSVRYFYYIYFSGSMKEANLNSEELIIEILAKSFNANQSVSYIIKQDGNRLNRLRALMKYSFRLCLMFGDVYLSDDNTACALVLYPDKKKATLASLFLDAELIIRCIGFSNVLKAFKREVKIKNILPKTAMSYIWFVGVDPAYQGSGKGTALMSEIIQESKKMQRPLYLETSTVKNLPWYNKLGFEVYNQLDLSYRIYFLRLTH